MVRTQPLMSVMDDDRSVRRALRRLPRTSGYEDLAGVGVIGHVPPFLPGHSICPEGSSTGHRDAHVRANAGASMSKGVSSRRCATEVVEPLKGDPMFLTLAVIVAVLWALGWFAFHAG